MPLGYTMLLLVDMVVRQLQSSLNILGKRMVDKSTHSFITDKENTAN